VLPIGHFRLFWLSGLQKLPAEKWRPTSAVEVSISPVPIKSPKMEGQQSQPILDFSIGPSLAHEFVINTM
jgi:hypothetical protein